MTYIDDYVRGAMEAIAIVDKSRLEEIVRTFEVVRGTGGRVFVIGNGGGAANATHFVSDLRKLCHVQAFNATDNVAELTARANDDGWEHAYADWLAGSGIDQADLLFVFSVGGGNREENLSMNLVRAIELAQVRGATVSGIVGPGGGYAAQASRLVLKTPPVAADLVTLLTESLQVLVSHLIVGHPALKAQALTWESRVGQSR
ncbi:SIS domain-containing protein [Curtobacterium sp. BRD11]|uniref:SIS domain-containing protein n=1 Tax=Curtobacterium sp. BRD11 TaxID=2962581 RepID=UPI0028823981|nr:SIS domain-containing protein [Curtobacterium sp. BRD11]MDT0212071.1 SIS domain-containing protein [Curtobacterium sp. BRD11]